MQLNHIDLQVSNIGAAKEFFERFFGLRCVYERQGQLAMLRDDAGFSLGLSDLHGSPAPTYPPDFHVGFMLAGPGDVREIYDRLTAAGVAMKFDLQEAGPALAFQCLGPDGIPVEVQAPHGA